MKHRTPQRIRVCIGCLAALALAPATRADPLTIPRWTVDGGGSGFVSNGPFTLGGTAGQPDAGALVAGAFVLFGGFWVPGNAAIVAVNEPPGGDGGGGSSSPLPELPHIDAATPNPLSRGTTVSFYLPEAGPVDLRIFGVNGSLVRTLAIGQLPQGHHALRWNANDAEGRPVSAGIYIVRIRLGTMSQTQKLLVMP